MDRTIIAAACALALAAVACGDNTAEPDPVVCGDGVRGEGEVCDGADLGDATCESQVGHSGTIACSADCTLDVSGCASATCGNGVAEEGEMCDGADLAGATCDSAGFSQGTIACNNCQLDVAGCCNDFCDAVNTGVCVEDSLHTCVLEASGCLGLEIVDCAATDDVCDEGDAGAACICVDRCFAAGASRCAGSVGETCEVQPDGCLDWVAGTDCGSTSQACAIGPDGPTCVSPASGEDCSDPYPITDGQNVIAWTATNADYLTIQPPCNASTLTGPDVVLVYTATVDGIVTFSMAKPASARQVIVASAMTCGTVLPEVACASDSVPTAIGDTFAVTAGTTYYFYVRDTTSGTATLDDPLILTLDEVPCAGFTNAATSLSPANASTIATTSPILTVELEHPISTTVGIITINGDLGTSRTIDLSTAPPQVTFSNNDRTMTIDPTVAFLPGEVITVSWSGIVDQFCAAPVAPPAWTFAMLTPSCTPGVGGMVGTSTARISTDLGTLTENYVAADTDPAGYVYVGGASDLYRIPKAGGAFEDVTVLAGITTTPLGSSMDIVGGKIFTLDTTTSATTPFLWRLSISGGTTWNPLGYGQFPTTAGAIPRGMFHRDGRLYIVNDETTTGVDTQIWSVSANAVSLPAAAVLEGSVAGEKDCDSISGDDNYFYLTCANGDRLVRVDRATYQAELITDQINFSLTKNEVHAHDFDGDGRADALYVVSDEERVHYVCDPDGIGPFWTDILVEYGTGIAGAGNYGLGFDPVANVLWAFDDDTREFVSIQ